MIKKSGLSKATIYICVIAVLFTIFNAYTMTKTSHTLRMVYNHPYIVSNTARNMRSSLLDMKSFVGVALTTNFESVEKSNVLFEERYATQNEAFDTICESYLGTKEDIDALQNAMDNLILSQNGALQYASLSHTHEEINQYIEIFVYPYYDDATSVLDSIITNADKKVYSLTNNATIMAIVSIASTCILTMTLLYLSIHSNNVERKNIMDMVKREGELEAALLAAKEASNAKKEFLSRMSHEMRTPLNSVLGGVHIAKIKKSKNQDFTEELELVEQSGQLLLSLINDVLDVSRIESSKIELHNSWCGPMETFETAIRIALPMMEEKNINFIYPKFDSANEKYELFIDPQRIKQVLINLLNNAAKYTPNGGTISFSTKNISHDDEYSTDIITISDTGCGMSKEFISRIGEEFSQEQNEYNNQVVGSGLGLFIVKKIIETMGGDLSVDSEIGKGSTFNIKIKYKYRFKESPVEKNTEQQINLSGLQVLCAEDIALNQTILRHLLEQKEIKVSVVSDGLQALEEFKASDINKYDAILMDIRMPVMNGMEATKEIRNLNRPDAKTIPIIAVSADAIQDDVEKAMSMGFNEYLIKPIEPIKMYQILHKICYKNTNN